MDDVLLPVDPEALRAEVQDKYREVAVEPDRTFHLMGQPIM